MKQKTRILALLLVLALLVQILPLSVFAEGEIGEAVPGEVLETETENPKLTVLGEMTDRRGESEKHFRMNDGSFVAVDYNIPVHYTTNEGATWEDIDNTLALSRGDAEIYVAENGDSVRGFASSLRDGRLFTVANGDYSLRLGMAADADNADSAESADSVILSEAKNPSSLFYNASAAAEISYPDARETDSSTSLRSAQNDGGENEELSFAEQITPAKLRADVLYRDVYDGVDLSYTLYSYNVKETIVLNRPRSSYSFPFALDAEGLSPVLLADGSIELRAADGEVMYLIPAPYMYDAAGAESNAVSYALEESASGSWTLTVTADADWINAEDRAFPVSIDPTVIDKVTWSAQGIGATYVVSGAPNTTHTHYQSMWFGYTPYNNQYEHQIYVGWDDLPVVPAGSEVVTAGLYLGQLDYQAVGPTYIIGEIHAVSSTRPSGYTSNYNWICGLSWNTKPSLDPTVLDYTTMSSATTGQYISWDITGLVKAWYKADNTQTRAAGIKLYSSGSYNGSYYATAMFHGYGSSTGPLFVVSYRDMTGIEPYYTYQPLGADRAGAAYISDYTGALTTVTPLVSYASTINPFSLNLVYNSSYFSEDDSLSYIVASQMGYGFFMASGMKLDIMQKVEYVDLQYEVESSGTKRYIKYTDGDGTAHYFATDSEKQANEPSGSTTYYYDEDGLGLKITEYSPSNHFFRMEDDKGNKSFFVNGFLTYLQDANGNRINIVFSDQNGNYTGDGYPDSTHMLIHHIDQKNNGQAPITVATFSYETTPYVTNLLRSVSDNDGNSYRFENNGYRLQNIKRKLKNETEYSNYIQFGYPATGSRMQQMIDKISSYTINFSYVDGRVSGFWEQSGSDDGAGANITRDPSGKTTYADWGIDRTANTADDISTSYLFDYAGRTVNAFSTDVNGVILGASNAVYSGIGNTDKQNNRSLRSAGIGMTAMPLLRNGNFERTDTGWTLNAPSGNAAAVVADGELAHTGEKALKLWVGTGVSGSFTASHNTDSLICGKTYTASVYVNTTQASYKSSATGIWLEVTDSNSAHTYTGDSMRFVTDSAIDDGWHRISVSFTAQQTGIHTVSIHSSGVKGVTYYDDFQLELGGGPSNFNLLQNGGLTYWGDVWKNENDAAASFASCISSQGNGQYDFSLKIIGDPKTDKYIHQTVNVNLPGTQTYVLSGWAKANAVPDNLNPVQGVNEPDEQYRERVANDNNKQFGLRAVLTYDDEDHTKEYHYVPFNADISDWQFTSLAIVPKQPTKTVSTIQVFCAYEKNANTAYFDNLSLVREVARTMRYDEDGNLVSVQSTGTEEESSSYENGNLTQIVTGGSGTFNYSYDNIHNLTEASNGIVKESYTRDPNTGNVTGTALTKATGNSTEAETVHSSSTYSNAKNLVKTVTDANGSTVTYAYESSQSKMTGQPTKTTDPNNTTVTTNYDSQGRVVSSWISSYISVNRTYASNGLLTMLQRGGYNKNEPGNTPYAQQYNFSYNTFGQTDAITLGENSEYSLAAYTYAPHNGLLTQMEYGNGDTVSYTYDNYGRKTQTQTSDGDSYTYAYSGDGQLWQMTDVSGNLIYRYTYDTLGRLIGSSLKSGSSLALQTMHEYDDNNRLARQIWTMPGKTYQESLSYDDHGRLTDKSVTLPGNTVSNETLHYDSLSRLDSVSSPISTTYYNYAAAQTGVGATGRVSQMSVNPAAGLTDPDVYDRLYYRYSYDALGNITQIKEIGPDNTVLDTTDYSYDNQGQLTSAVSTSCGNWSYQYDTYGNLRSWTYLVPGFFSESYAYTYGDAAWIDLLTGLTVTKNGTTTTGSYVYDGSGNPTSYFSPGDLSTWTMSWKNGRELATASNGTHTVSYDYDVNGLRTYKIVDGVRHDYLYASGQLLRESWTENSVTYTLDFVYDHAGRPYLLNVSTSSGGTSQSNVYYYILNLQGDVVELVNTDGEPVAEYCYDPYGGIFNSSGSLANINPLRYRGYYYDAETGFYYLQSRYYDPALGRFLNADSYASTGQGFLGYNMFAYCGNNPVSRIDKNGDDWLDEIGGFFATLAGDVSEFISGVVEDVQNFDFENDSEEKVLVSNYFSIYKGTPVIRTNLSRSGTFFVMFLSRRTSELNNPEDVVRHEYGHTQQMEEVGVFTFIAFYAIPSILNKGDDYYEKPCESTADVFGNVQSRSHSTSTIERGNQYLRTAKIVSVVDRIIRRCLFWEMIE